MFKFVVNTCRVSKNAKCISLAIRLIGYMHAMLLHKLSKTGINGHYNIMQTTFTVT